MQDLSKFPFCKHVTADSEVPETLQLMRRGYNSVGNFTGYCNSHWKVTAVSSQSPQFRASRPTSDLIGISVLCL